MIVQIFFIASLRNVEKDVKVPAISISFFDKIKKWIYNYTANWEYNYEREIFFLRILFTDIYYSTI